MDLPTSGNNILINKNVINTLTVFRKLYWITELSDVTVVRDKPTQQFYFGKSVVCI